MNNPCIINYLRLCYVQNRANFVIIADESHIMPAMGLPAPVVKGGFWKGSTGFEKVRSIYACFFDGASGSARLLECGRI
jgi:hypothetical protein